MLHSCVEDKIAFYNQTRFVENPNHPNGFNGTFAFTSVSKIPDDKINELLNELWEGPGSLEKIFLLEKELMLSGKDVKFTAADLAIMKSKKAEEEDEEKAIAEIREDNRT